MSPDTIAVGIFTIVGTLREQLEAERQAHGESRRLLAATLECIPPQLEAPQEGPTEPRESPVSPGPTESTTEGPERLRGPQCAAGGSSGVKPRPGAGRAAGGHAATRKYYVEV